MLILDTHIWVWWTVQQWTRIPQPALERLQAGMMTLAISASSVYELSVLAKRQRIVLTLPLEDWLDKATTEADVTVLPVTYAIARRAGQLDTVHGDPIDRLIIATTLFHDAHLISVDGIFPRYQELHGHLIR